MRAEMSPAHTQVAFAGQRESAPCDSNLISRRPPSNEADWPMRIESVSERDPAWADDASSPAASRAGATAEEQAASAAVANGRKIVGLMTAQLRGGRIGHRVQRVCALTAATTD